MNTKTLEASLSQMTSLQLMAPVIDNASPNDNMGSFAFLAQEGLRHPLAKQRQLMLQALQEMPTRKDGASKQKAFPDFYNTNRLTFMEWLHRSGAWPGHKQTTFFQHVDPFRRTFKRELKTWSQTLNQGKFDDCTEGLLMLATLYLSANDFRRTTESDLNVQRRWLMGPEGNCIRVGLKWLGSEVDASSINALQAYYNDRPYNSFWSTVYWAVLLQPSLEPELFSEISHKLGACLSNIMRDMIPYAMCWDQLGEKERNGLLLVLYGLELCYDSESVAFPFAACHPEIGERMGVTRHCYEGLIRPNGTPNKLFASAFNLTWSFIEQSDEDEVPLNLATQALSELTRLVRDADVLQTDLHLLQARQAQEHWQRWAAPFATALNALAVEWPTHLKAQVQDLLDCLAVWAELIGVEFHLSRPDSELRQHVQHHIDKCQASVDLQAFWCQTYLAELLAGEPKVEDFFDEEKHARDIEPGYSSASLKTLKTKAAEAVEALDTEKMSAASQAISAKIAFYNKRLESMRKVFAVEPYFAHSEEFLHQLAHKQADDADATDETTFQQPPEPATDVMLQLEAAKKDNDLLQHDLSELRQELYSAQQTALSLRAQLTQKKMPPLEVSSGLLNALTENLTVMDALDAVTALYPHVRLTDSALKSAEQCVYQQPRKLLEVLLRLAGPYYQAITVEKQPDATARNILGSHYKAQESERTISNDKLRAQREFDVNGEKVVCEQHLTLGAKRNPSLCMQVYFNLMDNILYIVYAGEHLETAST